MLTSSLIDLEPPFGIFEVEESPYSLPISDAEPPVIGHYRENFIRLKNISIEPFGR